MAADKRELEEMLDQVEAELILRWPDLAEPTAEAVANGGPFGMETMAYPQWLRYVFIPAARPRVASGDLPATSDLGVQAVREFDGDEALTGLTDLLGRFDAAVTT